MFANACLFAQTLLKQHKKALELATSLLLENETLRGSQLEDILETNPPQPMPLDGKVWKVRPSDLRC